MTTRSDITFSVIKLSQFMQSPSVNHWKALKRILIYISSTLFLGIKIRKSQYQILEAYSDVDWEVMSLKEEAKESMCPIGVLIYYIGAP